MGTVVGLTNSTGTESASYSYDPYGNSTGTTGSVYNPWRFAGGYLDSTGLYKYGIRYEDPTLGRWTQQDPIQGSIGDPSTLNRYDYANCNPGNLTDPTGADTWWGACTKQAIIWGTAGSIAGTFEGEFLAGLGIGALGGALGGCGAGVINYYGGLTGVWNFFDANIS